jgi:hypothetical protein
MWVTVRLKNTGQVQEMVPHIAQQLIASGMAEKYSPVSETKTGLPVVPIETATMPPPSTAVQHTAYARGPRSRPITMEV